ncbi:MAG TPA: Fe-S cluster assembly protein SufD [Cyclobacteriaceae bacterium]
MSVAVEKNNFTKDLIQSIDPAQFKTAADQRKLALEKLIAIGLPESKSEEYKFTPITRLLSKQFEPNEIGRAYPSAANNLAELMDEADRGHCVVFVNGAYDSKLSQLDNIAQVTIESLTDALESHSALVIDQLSRANESVDPFALLNNAQWQEGLFINVSRNSKVERPLVIYHLFDASNSKVAAHTRLFINIETSAEFSVSEKTNSIGSHSIFHTFNEDIIVNENASFKYTKIQNDPGRLIQVNNTTVQQHKSSRADTYTFTLNGKLIRNNLNILIDGEGCESHFNGLYLLDGDTLADNHTTVDHKKPNSFSNELYKGLMDGKSKGIFNGKIYVRPHAQKTNAFQSNRNILLSDTATINTKPQLEIWADDVKCSHGCTSGQLDTEALFYLQSRGIPKATAKAMLLYAFAGEVLETIQDEELKVYLDNLVSAKLHKSF